MTDQERKIARQTGLERPDSQNSFEAGSETEIAVSTIKQIKHELFDPRAISARHDNAGHREMEAAVADATADKTSAEKRIAQRERLLQQTAQESLRLEALRTEKASALERRLKAMAVRLKKLLKAKDSSAEKLREEISAIEMEVGRLAVAAGQAGKDLEALAQEREKLPDPEKLLAAYYEKMEITPLSQEEKREYLKPEILAELSTEEYIALWRRLNPHFLSHVTGQGFRDHVGSWYHSAGAGEFCNGFGETLRDNKLLRCPLGIELRARDERSIKKYLGKYILDTESEEEANDRLTVALYHSIAAAPQYPDKTAVHLAAELVADNLYGGERDNEIFLLYPSDTIASQYDFAFNGNEKTLTQAQSETMHNDVFVWPTTLENPGIPVDAGMVFLPENLPVDPETGSKYASETKIIDGEKKQVLMEDQKLISAFTEWARNLNDDSPVIKAYREYEKNRHNYRNLQETTRICSAVIDREISQLGFCEEAAAELGNDLLRELIFFGKLHWDDSITFEEAMQRLLQKSRANWKRAENGIPAREYWKKYFAKNPQQRPKHIIYYDGDPTTAIYEFQQKNNIGRADVSKKEGPLLGFGDRHAADMRKDPRANRGRDELEKTARRIIAEHYSNKK